jgi:putative heme-binding domain-containing protein
MGLAMVAAIAAQEQQPAVKNPVAGKPEAIEAGRTLYLASCAGCHGPNAEGGRGPRLVNNGSVRGADDKRLFATIKDGVAGSDMPPSSLAEDKIWQIAAFLKGINAMAIDSNPIGDIEAGARNFHGRAGCSACHAVKGRGGALGPDLTNIGMTRSVAQIRESILDPSARPTDGFQGVSVLTRQGRRIEGVAKDNTNYTIHVLDAKGTLHLLNKLDLAEIAFLRDSPMPGDYAKRLARGEIADLVAYLSRQAARPKGDPR